MRMYWGGEKVFFEDEDFGPMGKRDSADMAISHVGDLLIPGAYNPISLYLQN